MVVTAEELEVLELIGVRFGFRGVEFFATWPSRPDARWADLLHRTRRLFARKLRFRRAIARAVVRRLRRSA